MITIMAVVAVQLLIIVFGVLGLVVLGMHDKTIQRAQAAAMENTQAAQKVLETFNNHIHVSQNAMFSLNSALTTSNETIASQREHIKELEEQLIAATDSLMNDDPDETEEEDGPQNFNSAAHSSDVKTVLKPRQRQRSDAADKLATLKAMLDDAKAKGQDTISADTALGIVNFKLPEHPASER